QRKFRAENEASPFAVAGVPNDPSTKSSDASDVARRSCFRAIRVALLSGIAQPIPVKALVVLGCSSKNEASASPRWPQSESARRIRECAATALQSMPRTQRPRAVVRWLKPALGAERLTAA